jgi:hypothetical protein
VTSTRSAKRHTAKRAADPLGPAPGERPWTIYFSEVPQREFGYYGTGFLEAARTLSRSFARRRGRRQIDPLPIFFLYRHSIELLAKAVVLSGNRLLELSGNGRSEPEVFASFAKTRHKLLPLLATIREIFEAVHWEWHWPNSAIATYGDAYQAVAALEGLDPDSFSFRYPTTIRGQRAAPSDRMVGIGTILCLLDDLAEALDTALCGLDAEYTR